ncbi:MAG: LPS export ABC transporter permease LptF [Kordiimonadaceae bacterium]|nr:LPS export ABC transporter permease LptF [Kordiimonadaceae bacterium]
MFTRIDRYIIKQVSVPLFATLGLAALLLILEKMLRLFDFVVNQGGPANVVFKMLASMAPLYMGLALPVGLLLGVLLAFRKLSLSSEYDAITSSGVGLPRLMRPLLVMAFLLAIVNTALVGWIQPHSIYTYRTLEFDLRSGALGASIRVGEFIEIGEGVTLLVEESYEQGAELRGIFMERPDGPEGEGRIAVTAERGGFYSTGNNHTVLLRLFNGVIANFSENQSKPRVARFERFDFPINLPTRDNFIERGGDEREKTLPELFTERTTASTSQERAAYNANFHWRLMHSLTFFILPFLAVPMGLTNKRTGRATGIPIGLTLLIVYNELMEGMRTAVENGASPYASIWLLYVGFGALSYFFYRIAAFKAGGEPLALVDSLWAALSGPIKRMGKRLIGVTE